MRMSCNNCVTLAVCKSQFRGLQHKYGATYDILYIAAHNLCAKCSLLETYLVKHWSTYDTVTDVINSNYGPVPTHSTSMEPIIYFFADRKLYNNDSM